MNIFKQWIRNRSPLSPIREFVYLNETSVESLLASADGEILVQRTSTASRSSEASLTAGLSGKTPIGKASFAPALKTSKGSEVQELRKSVAQSAFARFRDRNAHQFTIRPVNALTISRRGRKLLKATDGSALKKYKQGIRVSDLKRGDLLEIETDLVAADIYKARTAISAVADVMDAYPSFASIELRDQLRAARPVTALIDSLNGDSIPVFGQNPSIGLQKIDGELWILNKAGISTGDDATKLSLEAQTLEPWFWGDTARILFRPERYTMLCRVINPSLSEAPSSSYIGAILGTIDSSLATTVDAMGSMFLGAMREGHHKSTETTAFQTTSLEVINNYVSKLGEHMPSAPLALPSEMRGSMSRVNIKQLTPESQVDFFGALDEALGVTDEDISPQVKVAIRDAVRTEHRLWPWSRDPSTPSTQSEPPTSNAYLEVAIVAVYW